MSQGGIELLLVEDNDEDAQYLRRLLLEFGGDRPIELASVDRARKRQEAVEMLDEEPDIVLLDLGLPDSNGLETIRPVVDQAPHIPVIVITGSRERGLGRKAIREGAQDYLQKGKITKELLDRTIRYSIDRHSKQRQVVELNHRLSVLHRIVQQDIRDDIHMMVGRADELQTRVQPTGESVVASLLDTAHHALELTDRASELLDLVSTDDEVPLQAIQLSELIENRVERLQENHDCSVTVNGADREIAVKGIPMLRTAIEQLLVNAVRHNESAVPEVEIHVTDDQQTVSITVADNGIGIPDSQKTLLNGPETRYHQRAAIGTGLYLALTVIDQIDGSIEFADNTPSGTVVTITLTKAQ